MAQASDSTQKDSPDEVGSVVFSGKKFKGELVIFTDKAVVFICEKKYYAPQLGNLRALRFFEIPSSAIAKITYDSGSFPISASSVQIFLKPSSCAKQLSSLKASVGVLSSMIHEDAENCSFTVLLK